MSCEDYPTAQTAKTFKLDAETVNEVVTLEQDRTSEASDGKAKKTLWGIENDATNQRDEFEQLASDQRDNFEASFSSQFNFKRIGNISDYAGQSLPEADKLNSYQFPDDSGDWYVPEQGQSFPITIPADPTVAGSNWYLQSPSGVYRGLWPDTGGSADKGDTYQTQVSGTPTGQYFTALQNTTVDPVADDVNWREVVSVGGLSNYTDIVYSSFEDMIDDNPIAAKVGQIVSTGSARWEKVSENGDASDFFGKYLQNKPANPLDFGIKYGTGKSQSEREDNSGNLQIAMDNCDSLEWAGITETYGQLMVRSSQKLSSKNSANSGIRGFHPTEATITDGTINQPDDINNNTSGVILDNIQIRSENGDAIHVTPYKWKTINSRFQAPNGKAFRYHSGGYQVENHFVRNQFENCGEGIYSGDGAYSATDQHIVDNIFANAGILGHAVNMRLPSGLEHRGNHYYQGALKEFVHFVGGLNCGSFGNYYEQSDNPRMWLDGGNPQLWVIADKFWGGDGSNTDYNGDQSSLIRLTVQEFAAMSMNFSGSSFARGTNEIPVFSLESANDASALGGVKVHFGKDVALLGSYSKFNQTVSPLGCGNIIQSDHVEFIQRVDQADATSTNPNLFRFTGSKYVLYGTGTSTVNSAGMPSSPRWCRDKPLVITNASAANFVLNSPITINGIQTILPGMTVSVMQHPININEYLVEPI